MGPWPLPGGRPGGTGRGLPGRTDAASCHPALVPVGTPRPAPGPDGEVVPRLAMPPYCPGYGDMCHPTVVPMGSWCPTWPCHPAVGSMGTCATPLLSVWGCGVPPAHAIPPHTPGATTRCHHSPYVGEVPHQDAHLHLQRRRVLQHQQLPQPRHHRIQPRRGRILPRTSALSPPAPARGAPKGAGEGDGVRVSPSG